MIPPLHDLVLPFLEPGYPASELIRFACAAAAILAATIVMLHSPHDVIEDVRVAVGPGGRKTIFAVSRHNLMRSFDDAEWKRLTRGLGAHKLVSLVVSPAFAKDRTVFVASQGGGVFRSRDGGTEWTACNDGLRDAHIMRLGISPNFADSGLLVALGHSGVLYRSNDRGDTWETACSHEQLDAGSDSSDGREGRIDGDWASPVRDAGESWSQLHQTTGISCVAFASDAILAGTSEGTVFTSVDDGASWKHFARLPVRSRITCIEVPVGSRSGDCLFVGTESEGVFRVSHAGMRVEPTSRASGLSRVTAIGSFVDANGDLRLLACSWNEALFVSRDRGASWILKSAGITRTLQADERRFGAPHFNAIAVAPGDSGHVLYVGGFDGLFRSRDLDGEWKSIETLPIGIVTSVALSSNDEHQLAVAAATYGAGAYLLPGGETAWQVRNLGLRTMRLGAIRFSPAYATDRTVFVAAEGHVMRSVESQPWQATPLLPPANLRSAPVRLFAGLRAAERVASAHVGKRSLKRLKWLFQSAVVRASGRVNSYVFPTVVEFSPAYREDGTLFVGTRAHGVFASADRGRSFSMLWDCRDRFVFSISAPPTYPSEGILYASLSDGIYRTQDAGRTWRNLDAGLRNARLVLSPSFDRDNVVFAGGHQGLWRSLDGGEHWHVRPVETESRAAAIGGIALSPAFASDGLMLVHVHGHGLYRSTDRGESFMRLRWSDDESDHAFTPLRCFPDADTLFQFSPGFARDQTVVAASMDRIYVSRDAGATWACLDKPTRYEATREEIQYRGHWRAIVDESSAAPRGYRSRSPFAVAELTFVGAGVSWIGTTGPDHGIAKVFVDGKLRDTVDLYAPQRRVDVVSFTAALPPARHQIVIQVQREKHRASAGREVGIAALDVEPVRATWSRREH